jgi:UDP-N-acetylglucosamine 1-carboxyvinyltransferase
MGVDIEGIGSNILTVHGVKKFKSTNHMAGSDYIEAGSLISLAASTNSDITITNIDTHFMRMILFQFERLGVHVEVDREHRTIHIPDNQDLCVRKDLGGAIPRIEDSPWPGFPADLTSIMLVTATQSKGTCLIHEKMFESRLFFVDKLISMGAQIVLCDPHRAVVVGSSPLFGSTISSPDIRAGMALLIAAFAAEGKSTIHNIDQIDRGYERIDERLKMLGAHVSRLNLHRRSTDKPPPLPEDSK